ncbi:hypothetical protein Tsubulata_019515 [Turnera subulata]|uniref:Uncharacterized protein n=1 Tax=Turnera subulata TaxID=218843 RepID=A0A9Q0JEV2_9ROSI|nr:hypothetical protein Tsubulata_019515 [Turnera subulata]
MASSPTNTHHDPPPIATPPPPSPPPQNPNPNPNMSTTPNNPDQDPIPAQDTQQQPEEQIPAEETQQPEEGIPAEETRQPEEELPAEETQQPEEEIPENQPNPPQSDQPQTENTNNLTVQIPDPPEDQPEDDLEELTPFSPTLSDTQMPSRRGGGGGQKRKRPGKKRNAAQEKKALKKLEILSTTLKVVPFVPDRKTLDFDSHEGLLRRLGLWDFVHLDFDFPVRSDLIAQLIAGYNSSARASYVNGVRVLVNRSDLARALKLPVKKEKGSAGEGVVEVEESEEAVAFVEKFVSEWLLLHDDNMWMTPDEVVNWMKLVKEGNFDKVDWASLVWFMVDKELTASPELENCYYASHLQILIKSQKEELLEVVEEEEEEEVERMEVDVKDDVEAVADDARTGEEEPHGGPKLEEHIGDPKLEEHIGDPKLEEHHIELSLGGTENDNNMMKDDEGDKEGKEEDVGDGDMMDFDGIRDGVVQGQWEKSGMDGAFLRSCSFGVKDVECSLGGDGEGAECGEEREEEQGVEDGEEEEEGGAREEEGEEEEAEDLDFHISPRGDSLHGVGNENLIATMEGGQINFDSGLQIHDDLSSGEFLASRVDAHTVPGSSSLFGNLNMNKREIEHVDDDLPHQMLNGGNKRMRCDEPPSDLDGCLEQLEHWTRKARMAQQAKEQEHQQMSMTQQQAWIGEVQQRDTFIQHLQKEQQKKQVQVYRLERELYMMGNLLVGYRKALKETHKAFAEYRAKCQLPEEPIYKDAGSGGLVLSTTELEKLRLKQEEERRLNRLMIEQKVKDFETGWAMKFESYNDAVEILLDKFLAVEAKFSVVKNMSVKTTASEKPDCAPVEETPVEETPVEE